MNHGLKSNEKEEYRSNPKTHNKYKEMMSTIPRRKHSLMGDLYHYEGFWCNSSHFEGILSAQATNPLLTRMAHDLVPCLELEVRSNTQTLDLNVPLLATHIPYTSLPQSIINSSCKIVYICRDPKDVFVSLWHFLHKVRSKDGEISAMKELHLEDAFELFCEGVSTFGPYWDHVLGYWRASLESPERILFLKYEDLKNDIVYWVKEIAQFMGYAFSMEEEDKGVVHKIINLCSF
jgi:hypothetical protein